MSYRKKTSKPLESANTRLASLKSIDAKMDLGNGLTIAIYENAITSLANNVNDYNTHLSMADEKKNQIAAAEKIVKDLSERMLAGVASKFGKDTDEYEKAGGVKKSERKKKLVKKKV